MKTSSFQSSLARLMLGGTLFAAAIIALGLVWYLASHVGDSPGGHIFSGEPKFLESPLAMIHHAGQLHELGHRRSLIMVGVVLLLLNPMLRVAFAVFGYAAQKDALYSGISLFVLAVLAISFFW